VSAADTPVPSLPRRSTRALPLRPVIAAATVVALPVASLVLWALLRSPSAAARLVAHPTGERWHDRATPTFGGVGIAAGVAAAVLVALLVGALDATWELAGILAGCAILVVAGLIDDARHLSPLAKLVAQFAAAGIAIAAGLRVELISNDVVGVAIALVWLVGITNAFNLLDNMDGLAATLATVACVYFAIDAATVHENDLVLVLALSLAFACLGFLPFNLRPGGAQVFMGDGGSQLLGFLLAALGLAASWTTAGTTVATMLLPLLVLAIPILDTTLVTIRRLVERRPVTQGGRDHSSHRLVYYGLSETKAVVLLALIAVALGATSVAYNVLDRPAVTALGVLVTFALLVQFGGFLAELSEQERRGRPGDTRIRHAVAVQPRRLVELLADAAIVGGTFLATYMAFVDGRGTELQRGTFLAVLPVLLGTTYVVNVLLGVYRRAWRYATARQLLVVALASGLATLAAVGIVVATRDLGDFPVGVFPVYGLAAAILAVTSRWLARFVPEAGRADDDRRRVLVVGAGGAGRGVARDLRAEGDVRIVGFLDDNPRLLGRRVQGVPVLGTTEDTGSVVTSARADELVVTIPDAAADRLEIVTRACDAARIPFRVVRERHGEARSTTQAIAE
jgi:UDP-GlcNAc:undecaprenyl-phosphate/decaprenyl-phosphate GlcNAc-1-phosphate transferase